MGWWGSQGTLTCKADAEKAVFDDLKRENVVAINTHYDPNERTYEVYMAYRTEKWGVMGVVALVNNRNGCNMVKIMDESEHPYYYHAGFEVLNALSDPPCNDNAREWRSLSKSNAVITMR